MTDIALVTAKIARVHEENDEVFDFISNAAITIGQALYMLTTGKVGVADANDSGKEQFLGIALKTVGANKAVPVMKRGYITGFTVSGLDAYALLYLSNTAGLLADAAGSMTVRCGRVVAMTDPGLTKVVYIDADWRSNWS